MNDNIKYKELFNLLLSEVLNNKYRAKVMLSNDLDLATHNFYNGQIIVLKRLLDSIEDWDLNHHKG